MAKIAQCIFWIALSTLSQLDSASGIEGIQKLYKDYFEWKMTQVNPEYAQILGQYHLFPKPKLKDYTVEALKKVGDDCMEFTKRASQLILDPKTPNKEKQYLDLLMYEATMCTKGYKYDGFLLAPVMVRGGVQESLPNLFAKGLQYKSLKHYNQNLKLMEEIPKQLEEIKNLLVEGAKKRITHARESLLPGPGSLISAKEQFEKLIAAMKENITKTDFYKHFRDDVIRKNIPEEKDILDLQNKAKAIITSKLIPAFEDLQSYVFGKYLDHLRNNKNGPPGVHSLPNGTQYYNRCINFFTSLSVDAEEIHKIGKREVKKLRKEAEQSAADLGMGNLKFHEIKDQLKIDESSSFTDNEEAMSFVQKQASVINKELPKLFSEKILQDYIYEFDIKPVPPGGGGFAYYQAASKDGSRNGTFYFKWQLLNKYETVALVLHEANPGHHLQISTMLHDASIPDFIRTSTSFYNPTNPGVYTGYREGWGLYSEFLGHEMDVYGEGKQILGYYSLNLLRASRLVVDTGIHAMKWTRKEAIDYLKENTLSNEANIAAQIDRYIGWPGQALAYKMGDLKIREIRNKFEKEQGFTIEKFHDGILKCQGPLTVLQDCIKPYMLVEG